VRRAVQFLDDSLKMAVPAGCVAFVVEDVTGQDSWERAMVLVNTQPKAVEFSIPAGDWRLFVDERRAGRIEILPNTGKVESERATVAGRSVMVLGEVRGTR